jgi:hypothetical protein
MTMFHQIRLQRLDPVQRFVVARTTSDVEENSSVAQDYHSTFCEHIVYDAMCSRVVCVHSAVSIIPSVLLRNTASYKAGPRLPPSQTPSQAFIRNERLSGCMNKPRASINLATMTSNLLSHRASSSATDLPPASPPSNPSFVAQNTRTRELWAT